jgi:uncharacterized membrane protein YphA (DoxX/SURF4 family)
MQTKIEIINQPVDYPAQKKSIVIAYWFFTLLISLETGVGAVWDLMQVQTVKDIFVRIGLPFYILTLLGIWKVLGLIAILTPGKPRLKEWAYAGLIFVYTGAAFSHASSADYKGIIAPVILAVFTFCSWALRPSSKRNFCR